MHGYGVQSPGYVDFVLWVQGFRVYGDNLGCRRRLRELALGPTLLPLVWVFWGGFAAAAAAAALHRTRAAVAAAAAAAAFLRHASRCNGGSHEDRSSAG